MSTLPQKTETKTQRILRVYPARVAAVLASIAGLVGAIVPVLGNFDTTSVAGWIAGLAVVALTVATWLRGNWHNEVTDKVVGGLETGADVLEDLEPFIDKLVAHKLVAHKLEQERQANPQNTFNVTEQQTQPAGTPEGIHPDALNRSVRGW